MISVFLPTRKGSERVLNKNTRNFAGFEGGLLFIKLNELIRSSLIDEIILSTNDPDCIMVAEQFSSEKLKVVNRPEELALSSTSLIDLVKYVPSICTYDNILWTHVTSPFFTSDQYDLLIQSYKDKITLGYDSLMTVNPINSFVWDKVKKDIVNRNGNEKWPRTQDLNLLYEINSAVFLSSKSNYVEWNNRIGINPYLYETNSILGFDIDWEDDFILAEKIYKGLNGKH
jgi:CMP-N-acetylneuraminic acid synthetase